MPRTPGEAHATRNSWRVYNEDGEVFNSALFTGSHVGTSCANARTAAIAHTAANKIDAMGFDGDKAIEMLPRLIEWMREDENNLDRAKTARLFMQAISEKDNE